MSTSLPPGQRFRADFPRFGLPAFAKRCPQVPATPQLRIGGDVEQSLTLRLEELDMIPRLTRRSDFHCVTTWSVAGLTWSGVSLGDLLEWAYPKVSPKEGIAWVGFQGLDGYRSCLPLEFARRPDVLLADSLDDRPLSLAHGAPIRVVAPAHYAYKSVKHLEEIRLLRTKPRSSAGYQEHPVGLVEEEQRVALMPGWLFRRLIRPAVGPLVRYLRRYTPPEDPGSDA
jgi:DMSO/TMAO reductase YedYZ molybdopterin-dependent catalytic subunit